MPWASIVSIFGDLLGRVSGTVAVALEVVHALGLCGGDEGVTHDAVVVVHGGHGEADGDRLGRARGR